MRRSNWEELSPGVRCLRASDFSLSDCRRTWDAIRSQQGKEHLFQESGRRRTSLLQVELEAGSRSLVVKQFLDKGTVAALKNFVRQSPGRRSWRAALAATERRIRTPLPLALIEAPGQSAACFVMEYLSDWQRADKAMKGEFLKSLSPKEITRKRSLLRAVAQFARQFHDSGIYQGDFQAKHVFVRETANQWEVAFIDLDCAVFGKKVSLAGRIRSLGRLDASILAALSRTDRLRWLKDYAQGDETVLSRRTIKRILAVSQARVARNPSLARKTRA